jgi:hypothetical protein
LEVDGFPILSRGDFADLMHGLTNDGPPIESLAAWLHGEDVPPEDLHQALDIGARIRANDDPRTTMLIDAACKKLEDLWPEKVGVLA